MSGTHQHRARSVIRLWKMGACRNFWYVAKLPNKESIRVPCGCLGNRAQSKTDAAPRHHISFNFAQPCGALAATVAVAHKMGAFPSLSSRGTVAKCCSPRRRSLPSGGCRAEAPAADGATDRRSLPVRAVACACCWRRVRDLCGIIVSRGV